MDLFQKQDFHNAEKLIAECYKQNRNNFQVVYLYALVKTKQEMWDESVSLFHESLKLDSSNVEAHYNLALTLQHQNRVDEAINCYKKALKLNPFLAEAHNNLAILYKLSGNFELAEQEYLQAVKAKPNNLNAVSNLGNLKSKRSDSKEIEKVKKYFSEGKFEKALSILKSYEKGRENDPDVLNLLGMTHYSLRNIDDSLSCYERLVAADKNSALGYYSLAVCFQAKENNERALQYYLKALEINPDYLDALNNLGLLYVSLKKIEDAERCYEKALDIDPDYYNCITNWGALKVNQDYLQDGIELFDRALNLALKNNNNAQIANAYGNIGFAKLRQLDLTNSIRYFDLTLD
ncbi:MAG: tetratricopeptide repeat protein, partial [Syntrophothermus sp.]